jgi:hypothetical protein
VIIDIILDSSDSSYKIFFSEIKLFLDDSVQRSKTEMRSILKFKFKKMGEQKLKKDDTISGPFLKVFKQKPEEMVSIANLFDGE